MNYQQQHSAYLVGPQGPNAVEAEEPLLFEVGSTHVGVVKRYNPGRGFGFITAESGNDIFLHQSKIVKEGFRSVAVGDVVRFGVALTDPRMYPTRTVEAVNVEILHSREPPQDPFARFGAAGGFVPKGAFHHQQHHSMRGGGGMRGGAMFGNHHQQHQFLPQQQHIFVHQQPFQQQQQTFVIPQQGAQLLQQGQQQQPTIYVIQAPASSSSAPQYFAIDAATLAQAQAQPQAQQQQQAPQPAAFMATGPTGETLYWTTNAEVNQ